MKPKQILILTAILAVLIAGIVIKKSQRLPELTTEVYAPLDLFFKSDAINKVVILKQKAGDKNTKPQVEMVKENGVWKLPGLWNAKADKNKVEKFLQEIQKAKGELRGKTKELFKDFGIGEEQGFQVSLQEGNKEVLGIVIGTQKASYGTVFVRKKGSESVYLTEANLYGEMGIFGKPEADEPQSDYWTAKNFAAFDAGQIKKIEIKKFQNGIPSSFEVEKEGTVWKFKGLDLPFPAGAEKANQYLTGIKNNPAEKVVDPKGKDYGFSKPRVQITIVPESGDPVEITVGDADTKDAASFYLKTSTEPVVFLISKYYVENMTVEADWFIANNPLSVDTTKIEKLIVHADKKEMSFQPVVKKWDALTSYLDGLKNFNPQKATGGKSNFGKYWVEIKKQGEAQPIIVDIADTPVEIEKQKKYAAQKRGNPYLFSISDTQFSQLFDNLSRLEEPKK